MVVVEENREVIVSFILQENHTLVELLSVVTVVEPVDSIQVDQNILVALVVVLVAVTLIMVEQHVLLLVLLIQTIQRLLEMLEELTQVRLR